MKNSGEGAPGMGKLFGRIRPTQLRSREPAFDIEGLNLQRTSSKLVRVAVLLNAGADFL